MEVDITDEVVDKVDAKFTEEDFDVELGSPTEVRWLLYLISTAQHSDFGESSGSYIPFDISIFLFSLFRQFDKMASGFYTDSEVVINS